MWFAKTQIEESKKYYKHSKWGRRLTQSSNKENKKDITTHHNVTYRYHVEQFD